MSELLRYEALIRQMSTIEALLDDARHRATQNDQVLIDLRVATASLSKELELVQVRLTALENTGVTATQLEAIATRVSKAEEDIRRELQNEREDRRVFLNASGTPAPLPTKEPTDPAVEVQQAQAREFDARAAAWIALKSLLGLIGLGLTAYLVSKGLM